MSCNQTLNGLAAVCDANVGGIREVYIANYSDVSGITYDSGTTMITGITMSGTTKFKTYNLKKNSSSMNSTLNVDAANGVNFVQTDVTLVFPRQDTARRIEVAALSLGELAVIVRDSNNKYWYLSREEFVSATAGTSETGTNRTDGNKYSITLTDYCSTYPFEVTAEAVAAVIE